MSAAIVLAAGASTRLGRPKQLETLGEETLLARAIRIARDAGLTPVVAVVRDETMQHIAEAAGARAVVNRKAEEGMASSIRAGVAELGEAAIAGAVVLTCDQVELASEHLQELAQGGAEVVASAYAGRKGVPAYFPAGSFPMLLALQGDEGARRLLQGARAVVCEALAVDVDTEAELAEARARLQLVSERRNSSSRLAATAER